MKDSKFKIGQTVQSHYRARWYGTVVRIEKRNDAGPLITVIITHDKSGNKQRKNLVKRLDGSWLTIVSEENVEFYSLDEETKRKILIAIREVLGIKLLPPYDNKV